MPRRDLSTTLDRTLGGTRPAHVSLLDNRFTLVDAAGNKKPVPTFDPKTGPYMDCVIIDVLEHRSRVFWGKDKKYDPANVSRPVCHSDNGQAPSINAQEPQAPACNAASCQWAVWGSATSAISGKGIPACQESQKLAIMVPGFDFMIFLLQVPPDSLKVLNTYNTSFRGQDFRLDDVVTRVSFEPGHRGRLKFEPLEMAEEEAIQKRDEHQAGDATDTLIGRGDRPFTGPIAATQAALPFEPPRPSPPEEPPPVDPTPVAPPAKRSPGRPRKLAAGNGGEAPKPPFPTETPTGFGIQEPSEPDAGVTKTLGSFFAKKQ